MPSFFDGGGRCVVLGGGGHAAVVIDALRAAESVIPEAVLDANAARRGTFVDGVPVIGDDTLLPQLIDQGVSHFVMGLGGAKDNRPRATVFAAALAAGLHPMLVQHPRSYVARSATVSPGAQVLCNAVVNPNARVDENVIVNTGAIVEHDCVIGAHSHIATGARLASGVTLGEGVHVGAGATIIQGISIGSGAVIGAGACVVRDVSSGTLVMGVPARSVPQRPQ